MRVLMINKFLYPNGGSETYIFKLGEYLQSQGHEVQYFGMEHEGRCVGNRVNAYTSDMDFHGGSKLAKLTYPIKTIYSIEARRKIRLVLDDFQPDVCHLNNFNYQLTPSIILEIKKWEKQSGHQCKIVFTAHDYQLVCPNHMLNNPNTHENCEKCLGGHFLNCTKGKCIHGSMAKSAIGTMESYFWKLNGAYKYIDTIICCSEFMKSKMDTNPLFAKKTVALHNFIDKKTWGKLERESSPMCEYQNELGVMGPVKQYILYYGRYAEEKGIRTLVDVAKDMPDVQFVFAGKGPLAEDISKAANAVDLGFCSGDKLKCIIQNASAVVLPSIWYEPFGLTIIEANCLEVPVIASDIGGISELISNNNNGFLFSPGDSESLKLCIEKVLGSCEINERLKINGSGTSVKDVSEYCENLTELYGGQMSAGGTASIT